MSLLTDLLEKLKKLNRRLLVALICYGVLIAAAIYLLTPVRTKDESFLLMMVVAILLFFVIKTLAHSEDE